MTRQDIIDEATTYVYGQVGWFDRPRFICGGFMVTYDFCERVKIHFRKRYQWYNARGLVE